MYDYECITVTPKEINIVSVYILSQNPGRIHPGKFPGENLFHKITPRRKTFGFFTSPTILHNLLHPGKIPNHSPQ